MMASSLDIGGFQAHSLHSGSESPEQSLTPQQTTTQFLEFLHTSITMPQVTNSMQVDFSRAPRVSSPFLSTSALEQLLQLPESFTANFPTPSIGVNLSNVAIDENIFKMFERSDELLSLLNSPTINLDHQISFPAYRTLEDHLVAIYFTYMNISAPMLKEDVFLKNYTPINRHPPALLNAIYALSCVYSTHPELYSKYKSPVEASVHFMRLAKSQLPQTKDRLTVIQIMAMAGMWEFVSLFG
ncbi:hypothetical protein BC829DRAFT_155194 [Chytridium lagenaria]|nr:hypothetical protein BC829DRAFT_155194 [Chytridium lagenaria]